jgi:hypothetical protein
MGRRHQVGTSHGAVKRRVRAQDICIISQIMHHRGTRCEEADTARMVLCGLGTWDTSQHQLQQRNEKSYAKGDSTDQGEESQRASL